MTTTTTINTLRDIFDIFNRYREGENARPWLFGPRTQGSTTEACLTSLPASRAVKPYRPPEGASVEGVQYFTVYAPELKGRQGAIAFSEVSAEVMHLVRMRIGKVYKCEKTGKPHASQEFYIDRSIEEAKAYGMPEQPYMLIIIGPAGDPWSWYPLPCLATLTAEGVANAQAKVGDIAVKLHRETNG